MENKKPKTIDEFFIEKYEKLEEENKRLEENLEFNYKRETELIKERDEYRNKLIKERDKWEEKYYELVERLKEDFKPEISKIDNNETYFNFRHHFIHENNVEKDKYYIDLFNLKEEGEEDNE